MNTKTLEGELGKVLVEHKLRYDETPASYRCATCKGPFSHEFSHTLLKVLGVVLPAIAAAFDEGYILAVQESQEKT